MEVMAIIPARAGSKRIPHKNVIPLNGKPMIEYALDVAIESKHIDTILVSSDCDIARNITQMYQDKYKTKNIIFMERPIEFSGDKVTTQELVDEILKTYKAEVNLVLQVTSPLRTVGYVDKCIELFLLSKLDSIFTVKEVFPHVYCPNGAVYVFKRELYSSNSGMILMPPEESIDIDTPLDLKITEIIMKDKIQNG